MHENNGNGWSNGSHVYRDVAEFLTQALVRNDPVVIISTPFTRSCLESELVSFGFRLDEMVFEGRTRCFDSHEVLERLLVNGVPDETRFDQTMEELLAFDGLRASRRRARAYYDLVDVLRARGDHRGAALLDRLLSALCERHEELIIAYTAANLYREKDCAV